MTAQLLSLSVLVADKAPEAKDVKAGWLAFGVFLLLAVAVALLCWSMVRQLRKAQAAKDAGVYGDDSPGGGSTGDDSPGSDSPGADEPATRE